MKNSPRTIKIIVLVQILIMVFIRANYGDALAQDQLRNKELSEKERFHIQYKIYKLENKPDWLMKVFTWGSMIVLFMATIMLTGK